MKNKICYLCGKPGADSKDHVPPKGLLPESQYGKYQRITVPAHRSCNSDTSDDEEYVRDILIMEAEALNFPKYELITPKVWRAWSKEDGFKRYLKIIKTAIPINLISDGGLYIGKAITVEPDLERLKTVGRKIIKGMIYYDSGAIIDVIKLPIGVFNIKDLVVLKEKDFNEPFWIGLSNENCLHDMCADTIAIRRFYECVNHNNDNYIISYFIVMLWNCVLLGELELPLNGVTNKDFKFCINTNNWTLNN